MRVRPARAQRRAHAAGKAALEQARPTHLAGVRRLFVDRFDANELRLLAGFWERVLPGATAE